MEVVRLRRIDSSRLKERKKERRRRRRREKEKTEKKERRGGKVKKTKSNPDSDVSTSQYRTWNVDIERGTGGTGGLMEEKEDG